MRAAKIAYEPLTSEELYPTVSVELMKLAWARYTAGLQSPAPSEERRYQRAVSRVRYAVRSDIRNQWTYVARCDAFGGLLMEIGIEGFGKWVTPGEPGFVVMHDAVFDAMATVPIHNIMEPRFGRIEFLAAVKKIAKEKYGEA